MIQTCIIDLALLGRSESVRLEPFSRDLVFSKDFVFEWWFCCDFEKKEEEVVCWSSFSIQDTASLNGEDETK